MPVPFVSAPNCCLVRMNYNFASQDAVNTLHFQNSGAVDDTARAALATAMHTFWTAHLKANLPTNISLQSIDVVSLDTPSSPSHTLTIAGGEAGTHSTGVDPRQVAWVVTHRTGSRGRSYRGRTYVPAIPLSIHSGPDDVNLTWITNVLNAFSWLITPANVANFAWVVLSKFLNGSPRTLALPTPITAVDGDQFVDSQNRRAFGRGS